MQRNWIGRSTARLCCSVPGPATSRCSPRGPTRCSARRMVLAPEHDLVDKLTAAQWPADVDARWTFGAATPAEAIAAYRAIAAKSDLERQENKAKTAFLGSYATNPANGQQIRCSRRLRADRLRHRSHHGRARWRPADWISRTSSACPSSKSLPAGIFRRRPTAATVRWSTRTT